MTRLYSKIFKFTYTSKVGCGSFQDNFYIFPVLVVEGKMASMESGRNRGDDFSS